MHLHTPRTPELEGSRALIARDLADVALLGLSADRRFATACNAALQTARMAVVCSGYRIAQFLGTISCILRPPESRLDPSLWPFTVWVVF